MDTSRRPITCSRPSIRSQARGRRRRALIRRSHPSVFYWVDSKTAALKLIEVLDAFPLRAAKAHHYEVWCRAVTAWAHHKPGAAWTDLGELAAELRSMRHYDPARQFVRNPAVAPKDRAAFDKWFAGFTDGGGCFGIHLNNGTYQCRFSIQMRADDAPILNEIRDTFAIGSLHYKPPTATSEERWLSVSGAAQTPKSLSRSSTSRRSGQKSGATTRFGDGQ